jgi:acid phosphatase family membrane protein YuiD
MEGDYNIFYNNIVLVPFIAYFISVILKAIVTRYSGWKPTIWIALESWGMPSSHTPIVISLTSAIALKFGLSSDFFALALTYSAIIIYDAINVRYQAWLHAGAINERLWEKRFKESLGHLPSEAFAWAALGAFVSLILYFI